MQYSEWRIRADQESYSNSGGAEHLQNHTSKASRTEVKFRGGNKT